MGRKLEARVDKKIPVIVRVGAESFCHFRTEDDRPVDCTECRYENREGCPNREPLGHFLAGHVSGGS